MKFFFFFFSFFAVSLISTSDETTYQTLAGINEILSKGSEKLAQERADENAENSHLPTIQNILEDALRPLDSALIADDKNALLLKKTLKGLSLYLKFAAAQEHESETTVFHGSLASFQGGFLLMFMSYAYLYSERVVYCDDEKMNCEEYFDTVYKIPGPIFAASLCNSVRSILAAFKDTDEKFKLWQEHNLPSCEELYALKTYLESNNYSKIAEYIPVALTMNDVENEEVPEQLRKVFFFGAPEQKTWVQRFIQHFWHRFF